MLHGISISQIIAVHESCLTLNKFDVSALRACSFLSIYIQFDLTFNLHVIKTSNYIHNHNGTAIEE